MTLSWIVLLPPLLVLLCAAISRNVLLSLLIGVFSAAFIAQNFSIWHSIILSCTALYNEFINPNSLYLFGFLILLGATIEMMTHSGGISSYTKKLQRYICDKRSAETLSLSLSTLFFLDDYLNGFTIGAIMRPLTDTMKIPRIKLAYLINSVSAPLCVIAPATVWVAMILGQLEASGISDRLVDNPVIFSDPLNTYFQTIPFLFYPFFAIFGVWLVVRKKISFGTMRQHEICAEETDNLFGGKEAIITREVKQHEETSGSGFIVPLITFLASMLVLIFYSGNLFLFGGNNGFMIALKTADSFWSLFWASVASAVVAIILFLSTKKLTPKEIALNLFDGIKIMLKPCAILLFAYAFSTILITNLQAGVYLGHLVSGIIPIWMLPVIIFFISTITSAATGSSWGTIAIMLPLTVNMLVALSPGTPPFALHSIIAIMPTLGALLAGSVAGAHFSPIADSTVMASTSARAYHLDHVQTQISYSIPALIGATLAFIILGLTLAWNQYIAWALAFFVGLFATAVLLLMRNQAKN